MEQAQADAALQLRRASPLDEREASPSCPHAKHDDPANDDNNGSDGAGERRDEDPKPPALRVRVAPVIGESESEAEGFGIKPGTLEVVEASRRPWVHAAQPPLMASGEPSPIVEELTRSWRVLRLQPAHPLDGLVKKRELSAETTLLKNYEPRVVTGEPTFPGEICVPGYLQPRVAVEDATAFLVSPRVRFALGMIEPLYCRVVMYDVQLGCRASEEFTFLLPAGPSKPPRAIFYALPNHQAQHLYLVLKVSKGLVGDADLATAPYCSPEKFASDADQQRLAERAADSNRRLGRYSQPLAWGAIALVEGSNRPLTLYRQRVTLSDEQRLPMIVEAARSGFKEKTVPAMCEVDIERVDDQRLDESKYLIKSLKTLSKEAFKLPSCPILELHDPFTPKASTDEGTQQQSGEGEEETNDVESAFYSCREVQPLCHPSAYSVLGLFGSGPLAMSYVHAMYVYALHVDRFQFRNIAVRVQLLQREVDFVCGMDEFDTQDAVVPAFYGPDHDIVSSAFVQVNYHQKNPQFEKEIKLCLPDQLTPSHHLLFTFFHVHCKKLQPGQQQQELVGCCALPILGLGGALLDDSEYVLNVLPPSVASKHSTSGGIISLSPGYVEAARSPSSPDSSRTSFTLRTRALSSLRSQDPSIATFLEPFQSKPAKHLDAPTNEQAIERITQVRQALPHMLRHFFLPITRFLLAYMRFSDDAALRQTAFRTLLTAFEKAKWNDQRSARAQDPNDILQQFTALVFDNEFVERCAPRIISVNSTVAQQGGKRSQSTMQAVVLEWIQLLRTKPEGEEMVQARILSLRCANFFLQIILKAMALQRSSKSAALLPLRTSREDDILVEDLLVLLVEETTNSANGLIIQKHVNESIASFCRGLFLVTRSTLPMRIINFAVGWMQRSQGDVAITVHILFRFLKTLIEFEFFAIVNAFHSTPPATEHGGQRRGAWLARLIFERLLQVVDEQVEDRIRSEALALLRRMFVLQVYNPRHQNHEQQELIALMYFPMIPSIARFTTDGKLLATGAAYADALDSTDGERASVFRKELLICVAHLLSSVTLPYLSWYFRQSALVVGADTIERDNTELPLSPTASLLHYRTLVEETKLRASDARRQSLIQRSLDKAFAVTNAASRATVYDEVRVHACLSLVRQVIEVFLVDDVSQSSPSLQVLSPDLAPCDRRVSLLDLEVQRKNRQSRLRGGSLGQDTAQHPRSSVAAGSKSPNAKFGPSSGSFSVGSAAGPPRLTAQKSLPRNWGKNYASAQNRSSVVSSGDVTKSSSNSTSLPSASNSGSKRISEDTDGDVAGDEYEMNTRNLHRIIADTTLKAIRTAIDQFEWVIRIIESPLDYKTSGRRTTHGRITVEHAFTLLGSIVDIFFLLMKRASAIECLCTTTSSEIDEEVDEEADCFLADLFRQLQAFVLRFQRALFATRIAGLPLIHDQSRIFLLVSLSASAKLSSVRQLAASLLCRLIHVCYEQTGSFLLIKRPLLKVFCANFFSTSALQIPTDALRDAIDLWRQQVLSDHEGGTTTDHAFELLLGGFLNSLTSQIKVFETWHRAMVETDAALDGEELEEGLYRVVQSVSTFWLLDVKTQWMDALIQLHAARKRYAEATCCALENITFKEEAERAANIGCDPKQNPPLSAWVVLELRSARDLAQKANWIEKVVEINERLLLTLRQHGRFVEYRETLRLLDSAIQQLAESSSEQASTQVFAFYRVVLAGDCVPLSVAAHEYVYKRSRFVSLGEFVGEMKSMLRARFPTCERVDIIPESKPIPSLERNPNVVFMRVTNLELFPHDNQPEEPIGASFRFSTPFTLANGASYGKTAEQMKRVIYLSTTRCFPSVTSRQVVSLRREEVRCPIDNSMDDIRKRCGLLQDEINKETSGRTDLKTLTLVLKGSVDTHVHGGIPEVIDAFLAKSTERGDCLPPLMDVSGSAMDDRKATDKREELADLLVEFLELCWVCLLISRLAFRRTASQPSQQQSSSFFGSDSNGSSSTLSTLAQTSTRQRSRSSGTASSNSSIARMLASLSLIVVVDDDASPSPLQVEFERSYGVLVDQMRTKVTFSYARDGDLAALYEHVQRHTRTRAIPQAKPSLSSMVLASAAPPPPSPPSAPATASTASMLLPPPPPVSPINQSCPPP